MDFAKSTVTPKPFMREQSRTLNLMETAHYKFYKQIKHGKVNGLTIDSFRQTNESHKFIKNLSSFHLLTS